MALPQFRTGTEEAEAAAARTAFLRVGYVSIEEGGHAVVRMLTDHDRLLTVMCHNNPPTRPMPKDYKGKWPKSMPATCRLDKAFRDMGYPDCFNCLELERTGDERAFKPKVRSTALAVVRKPMMKDGRFVGFEDDTVEIKDGEGKKLIPHIVVLNYAWQNFWGNFNALKSTRGTWVDSDLHIARTGKDIDSSYSCAAYPVVGLDGMKCSEGADVFDIRNFEHAKKYIEAAGLNPKDFDNSADAFSQILGTLVAEKASDEFYARFYDTRVAQPERSVVPDNHTPVDKPAADEPSEEELAELAARVTGHPEGDQELQTMAFS